jgi:hypothetical protein
MAGYEPADDEERRLLDTIVAEIGFSPIHEPERLESTAREHPCDAKRICDRVTAESEAREAACLDDLTLLRARGVGCGVRTYLDEVGEKLIPVVRAPARHGA